MSGIVELSPNGSAIKSPWPGDQFAECCQDLDREAQIYDVLGEHDRIVKIKSWNEKEHVLEMEYLPNGCLRDYIDRNNDQLLLKTRIQ